MRFNDVDLKEHATGVKKTLVPSVKEVKTDEQRWHIRKILPFRTNDNRLEGLVLTFADVTEIKKTQEQLLFKKSFSIDHRKLPTSAAGILT
jgi:two-component system, chemotaxis family, CheB/CheR fusion protein